MHTSLAHQVHRIMMAQFTITPTVHHRERLATLRQHPRDVLWDATPRRAAFPRATVAMLAPFGPSSLAFRLLLWLVLPRRSAARLHVGDQDRV